MIKDRISKQLSECVCVEYNDTDTIIGLPYPYSVPTPGNTFRALYYWDTYFTNLGLICTGNLTQAKYNVNDMLYMADRFGFVPNGSRMKYLTRSQPPFLSIMVRDIYEVEKNNEWLEYAYRCLAKEYDFWGKKRTFDDGLSHYGYTPTDGSFEYLYDRWVGRTGVTADVAKLEMAGNYIAQAESGWDFSPRFGIRGQYICCPDLNSLLWKLEKNMAYFSEVLENNKSREWECLAEKRKQKINDVLWNNNRGCFTDIDYIDQRRETFSLLLRIIRCLSGLPRKNKQVFCVTDYRSLNMNMGFVLVRYIVRSVVFSGILLMYGPVCNGSCIRL